MSLQDVGGSALKNTASSGAAKWNTGDFLAYLFGGISNYFANWFGNQNSNQFQNNNSNQLNINSLLPLLLIALLLRK